MLPGKPCFKQDPLTEKVLDNGSVIRFRSFEPAKDSAITAAWVCTEEARESWPAASPGETQKSFYRALLKNPGVHCYTGLLDEQLSCLIALYRLPISELNGLIPGPPDACVLHLLMSPGMHHSREAGSSILRVFCAYYFSFTPSRYLYAVPGIRDSRVQRLLEKSGFRFLQNIVLPRRMASLYLVTRRDFDNTHCLPVQ